MHHVSDDIATGDPGVTRLPIVGRPGEGSTETWIILEGPTEPVLMHFVPGNAKQPHFRANCPNCKAAGDEPTPYWYVGAIHPKDGRLAILELTRKCWATLDAWAAQHPPEGPAVGLAVDQGAASVNAPGPSRLEVPAQPGPPVYAGILVEIGRADFSRSPRWLRCERRIQAPCEWPFHTRTQLCRIWGINKGLRVYREEVS